MTLRQVNRPARAARPWRRLGRAKAWLPGPSLVASSPEQTPANGSSRDLVEEEIPTS